MAFCLSKNYSYLNERAGLLIIIFIVWKATVTNEMNNISNTGTIKNHALRSVRKA